MVSETSPNGSGLGADPADCLPVWMIAFHDQAELGPLALSAYLALGDYPTAEYHAHRRLSALRPPMVRSRAVTTTRLAHAQLAADVVTATAMKVPVGTATRHIGQSRPSTASPVLTVMIRAV